MQSTSSTNRARKPRITWQVALLLFNFAVSLTGLWIYQSVGAMTHSIASFLLLIAAFSYWYAFQRGQLYAAAVIGWLGNVFSGFVLTFLSHDLLPISLLAMIDSLLYSLHPNHSNRSIVRSSIGLTVVGIVLIVLFAELIWIGDPVLQPAPFTLFEADLRRLLSTISSSSFGAVSASMADTPLITVNMMLIGFIGFHSVSILNHLGMFYRSINDTIRSLEKSNEQVAQAHTELRRRLNEQTQLLEVSRTVSSTMDLNSLLLSILAQLRLVIEYGRATVMLMRNDELIELCTSGELDRYHNRFARFIANPEYLKSIETLCKPVLLPDLSLVEADLPGTLIAVPLIVRGRFIGLLTIRHPQKHFYTARDADLGMAFANQVAGAIDIAQLQATTDEAILLAERSRLARELHESVLQSIYGIVLGTRTALKQIDAAPQAAQDALRYSADLANCTLAEMRALIFSMRPDARTDAGPMPDSNNRVSVQV
jgi:signal transduction histidine kinase